MRPVAVVTDSTASLPAGLVEAADVVVVPLDVVIDGVAHREGVDINPAQIVAALLAGAEVRTAHPGPEVFSRAYARVAARGAAEIVSVHLSAELSGTVTAAELGAQSAGVPVHVVDSRTVGMGLGFAVLAAAHLAAEQDEPDGVAVARAAERRAAATSVRFTVDTLEHLRAGGRLGALSATLGSVLGLRPVLAVRDGRLEVAEKVRTSARSRERVIDLAIDDAKRRERCELAVHYLGDPAPAQQVAERLANACHPAPNAIHVAEISAVIGAHAGPGLLAVVVADA
jgi:DegV family protein with EDD domain